MKKELVVDALIELESPSDMHTAFQDIKDNGYISHETYGQNLLVAETENGIIGVQAANPTYIFGLIVNIHNIKRQEILKRFED